MNPHQPLADQIAALVQAYIVSSQPAPKEAPRKRLLKIKEAAEYLSFSEGALRQVIRRQKLPVIYIGKSVRLDVRDLDMWIANNRV